MNTQQISFYTHTHTPLVLWATYTVKMGSTHDSEIHLYSTIIEMSLFLLQQHEQTELLFGTALELPQPKT